MLEEDFGGAFDFAATGVQRVAFVFESCIELLEAVDSAKVVDADSEVVGDDAVGVDPGGVFAFPAEGKVVVVGGLPVSAGECEFAVMGMVGYFADDGLAVRSKLVDF